MASIASIIGLFYNNCDPLFDDNSDSAYTGGYNGDVEDYKKRLIVTSEVPSTGGNISNRDRRLRIFANYLHVTFEVIGSTAFLVTTVAFSLLDHSFTFFNLGIHFVTSCCIIVEMLLNSFYVDACHIIFHVSWPFIYCIFIWLIVVLNAKSAWPYSFLDSSSIESLLWYVKYSIFKLTNKINTTINLHYLYIILYCNQ